MKRTLVLLCLVTVCATAAFADIARPDKTPARTPKPRSFDSQMEVRLDRNATEAVLVIPRSQLKRLRAELEDLDDQEGEPTAAASGIGRVQTLMSGLFLSLAVVFGGVWFFRSGKASTKGAKSLVILAAVSAIGSAATFVYGNIGPPLTARSITGKIFADDVKRYGRAYGKIRVESGDGSDVTLIVPDPQDKPSE